jgi:acetyltransferase
MAAFDAEGAEEAELPPPVGLGTFAGPDGDTFLIREASPADEGVAYEAFGRLSEESRYNRFMSAVRELPADLVERLRHPDPSRELILAMFRIGPEGEEPVGAARLTEIPDGASAEFSLIIADEWQRKHLGSRLLGALIANARARGLKSIRGLVLGSNEGMLGLARYLGFHIEDAEDGAREKTVTLALA